MNHMYDMSDDELVRDLSRSSNLFNRSVLVEMESLAFELIAHMRALMNHLTLRGYSAEFVRKTANLHPIAASELLPA